MIWDPSPEQAVHVLKILNQWMKDGGTYRADPQAGSGRVGIFFEHALLPGEEFTSSGVNHFDAICQATTAMQILLPP